MPRAKSTEVKQVQESTNYFADVEKRAYELFLERSNKSIDGNHFSDWIQAEKEIKSKYKM